MRTKVSQIFETQKDYGTELCYQKPNSNKKNYKTK